MYLIYKNSHILPTQHTQLFHMTPRNKGIISLHSIIRFVLRIVQPMIKVK